VADSLAAGLPEHFADQEDTGERLKEMLAEGNPEPMAEDDAYAQALDHLRSYGGASQTSGWDDEDEPVPFARRGELSRYAPNRAEAEGFLRYLFALPGIRELMRRYGASQ
jgi:hypothetical protein